MAINTKKVTGTRDLRFNSLDEILAEAEVIDPATATTLGNWTAAQIVEHVARFMTASRTGFPADMKPPLFLRVPFTLLRGLVVHRKPPRGVKMPRQMVDAFVPPAETNWDDALSHLRSEVNAINNGERFTRPSPLFGKLSHEQWLKLHCGHAAMHMGYILPAKAAASEAA